MRNPRVTYDFFSEIEIDLSSLETENSDIQNRRANRMSVPDIFK